MGSVNRRDHIFVLGKPVTQKAREPKERGESKRVLVESGMYAFVRHPEFLGHMLIFAALVLIAQRWASMIIGIAQVVLLYFAMLEEDRGNLEKFGDAYKDYMRRVPRINLIAGIKVPEEILVSLRPYYLDDEHSSGALLVKFAC